ncbi:MAG: sulfate adenylyltransferase subunit 1 [Flavobacteriales bacterium]|jgi:sulfate adenylyltransferase subunit 1
MDILRIATSGSVDDGKSTLIGRLLYETKHVPQDKLEQLKIDSERRGLDFTDLSLLTDGLISEREQGITIDVAHVYFATAKRKYIIADTPGHEEYTRNMVTGASQSDVAIVLIDARKGILPQTKRHLSIANLLQLKTAIIAINKMDLLAYSEDRFNELQSDVEKLAQELNIKIPLQFIPISALEGEGITAWTGKMDWFKGLPMLQMLDNIDFDTSEKHPFRFNVQTVIRPKSGEFKDYRGYAGTVLSGEVYKGMKIKVAQTDQIATISNIEKWGNSLQSSGKDKAVTLLLKEEVDLSRGDYLVAAENELTLKRNFRAHVCWMGAKQMNERQKLILQQGTRSTQVLVDQIQNVLNMENSKQEKKEHLALNDIGAVAFKAASAIPTESFSNEGEHGGFILIDPSTYHTVGAGFMM